MIEKLVGYDNIDCLDLIDRITSIQSWQKDLLTFVYGKRNLFHAASAPEYDCEERWYFVGLDQVAQLDLLGTVLGRLFHATFTKTLESPSKDKRNS